MNSISNNCTAWFTSTHGIVSINQYIGQHDFNNKIKSNVCVCNTG